MRQIRKYKRSVVTVGWVDRNCKESKDMHIPKSPQGVKKKLL